MCPYPWYLVMRLSKDKKNNSVIRWLYRPKTRKNRKGGDFLAV